MRLGLAPISTVLGLDGGDTGDGGPATQAELDFPVSVAVDAAGDIFIGESCGSRIQEVNHATGVITTIAGNGTTGDTGDGGPATSAEIGWPFGLVVDGAGNLYFSDAVYSVVRKVNLTTGVITTVAGGGTGGSLGDGGPATAAELCIPDGLAVDAAGDLFIADEGNCRVREVNHATGVITTVAGDGGWGYGGDGGPATAAELDAPEALGFDAAGDLFILDDMMLFNNFNVGANVREVNHATGVISTVAGNNAPSWNSSGDGGPATAAQLGNAADMAVDASGDVFIDERSGNNLIGGVIREVNHATGVITDVAGNGPNIFDGNSGPAASAYLSFPSGIALDANGDLFIADVEAGVINEVQHASLSVTVSQAIPTVTVSDPGGTYNGSPFAATALVAGVVSGVDTTPAASLEGVTPTISYYVGSSVNGPGSTTAPTSAGTYTVVASFPGSSDYTAAQSSPMTFTIGKATPILADAGGTYNGQSFPATVTEISGTAGSSLEGVGLTCTYYAGTGTSGTNLGATAPTSAGTYTVVASFPGSTDYTAAQSSPMTFTIVKATPILAAAGGTYNGQSFPATVTGISGTAGSSLEGVGLTCTYYAGTGTGGTNLGATAPTSAGTYTVVASFPGSTDYTAANSQTTFTIARATPTLTLTAAGGTYDGSPFAATALVSGVVSGVDTAPAPSLEGVFPTCTYYVGTGTSGTNLGSTAPTRAGTYTVVASFLGSTDYGPSTKQTTFIINQAMATLTLTDVGGTYDGSPFAATAMVAGVVSGVDTAPAPSLEGVFPTCTYYVGNSLSGTGSTAPPSGAGTYTVVATFPGSTDYAGVRSSPLTFTIGKAAPTLADSGGTYNGATFPATVAGISGVAGPTLEGVGLACTYYVGTGTSGTNLGNTAPTHAGTYTVVASFPGSTDYASASQEMTFTINQAAATLNLTDAGGTYNGSPFPASALISGVVSGVDTNPAHSLEGVSPTITYYVGSTASGTGSTAPPTSAGTYTVVASFPGSADYAAAQSSPVTFTINQAMPTLTLSDAGGTFNGLAFAGASLVSGINAVAASMLEGVNPTLTYYAGSSASGTGSATAPTSAGTFTVVASFPGSADYTAAQSSPLTFTINKATPTLTLSDAGGIFNGSAFAAASLVSGVVSGVDPTPAGSLEGVSPSFTYYAGSTVSGTGSATAPTSAGTYTVMAVFPGSTDYTASSQLTSFSVNRATPSITWANPVGITYGTALGTSQLDATSSVPGTFTYGPFAGWLLSAGRGQLLTAVFVPVDATDYTQATATVQINVAPAPLTITALPAGKFAGQPNPGFSSSYTGFVLGQGPSVLSGSISFNTAANTASAPGSYPIIPGGLWSPNYAITYVAGTLAIAPAPVTVTSVQWQTMKLSRHKTAKVLEVFFSGALDSAAADRLTAYAMDSATHSKKVGTLYNKPIALRSVNYNAANNSVTLTPRGTFPNVTMQLSINASLVLDAEGRQLDGDGDGTPGGSYTALLNNRGVVSAARSLATVREALATHLRLG